MKYKVPSYYKDFKCIAGSCKHTCCEGWEIDVDEASVKRFRDIPGIEKEMVITGDTAHFRLKSDERCPFLTEGGLCDLILEFGEDILCNICRDHPRFIVNTTDSVETGIGMACEAAADLILSDTNRFSLITVREDDTPEEADMLLEDVIRVRDCNINALYDGQLSERIRTLYEGEILKDEVRNQAFSQMEYMDANFAEEAKTSKGDIWTVLDGPLQNAYRNLMIYFLFRHPWEGFELCTEMLIKVAQIVQSRGDGIEILKDTAREFSAEIEYSDTNPDILLEYL